MPHFDRFDICAAFWHFAAAPALAEALAKAECYCPVALQDEIREALALAGVEA